MAAKPRVHEVAAELGVDSKLALAKLKEMGQFVKGPSSSIEPPVARRLKEALLADGAGSAAPAPAKAAAAPAARPGGARTTATPGPARPAAPAQPSAPVAEAPPPRHRRPRLSNARTRGCPEAGCGTRRCRGSLDARPRHRTAGGPR
ncbi:protein of unknown function [Agreia sp. COWG]|nr:protein of unknown function [Agreia sp. COWG]